MQPTSYILPLLSDLWEDHPFQSKLFDTCSSPNLYFFRTDLNPKLDLYCQIQTAPEQTPKPL